MSTAITSGRGDLIRSWVSTRRPLAGILVAVSLLASACSLPPPVAVRSLARPTATPSPAPSPPGPSAQRTTGPNACGDATRSLRPEGPLPEPGSFPQGSFMRRIYDRGRLVAGVSQDRLLLGYLNPTSNQLEGFDIDIVKQMARAIFGDENRVEYRAITSAQRIPLLQNGTVDIVALTMTVNCDRWRQIDFSSVYYLAGQRVLTSSKSQVKSLQDLGGKRVCAAAGTTSIDNIVRAAGKPIPVSVPEVTDCLVQLQRGQVDAISTDDTILVGLAAQDPSLQVVGPRFTDEPYGLGISQAHPEFVRFVNAVLEQMRADGSWKSTYGKWLWRLGPAPAPPAVNYRD
jgi:polar amino acid transport system substrate-binding protein